MMHEFLKYSSHGWFIGCILLLKEGFPKVLGKIIFYWLISCIRKFGWLWDLFFFTELVILVKCVDPPFYKIVPIWKIFEFNLVFTNYFHIIWINNRNFINSFYWPTKKVNSGHNVPYHSINFFAWPLTFKTFKYLYLSTTQLKPRKSIKPI